MELLESGFESRAVEVGGEMLNFLRTGIVNSSLDLLISMGELLDRKVVEQAISTVGIRAELKLRNPLLVLGTPPPPHTHTRYQTRGWYRAIPSWC